MSFKFLYDRSPANKRSISESPIIRKRSYKASQDSFLTDGQDMSDSSPDSVTTIKRLGVPAKRSAFALQDSIQKCNASRENTRSRAKTLNYSMNVNTDSPIDVGKENRYSRANLKPISSLQDIDGSNFNTQNPSTSIQIDSLPELHHQPIHGGKRQLTVNIPMKIPGSIVLEATGEETDTNCEKFPSSEPKYFWRLPHFKISGVKSIEPEGREGAVFMTLGSKLYLYGGAKKTGLCDDLWRYKPGKESWKKIVCENSSSIKGRTGHSAVVMKGCLYIFGGEMQNEADLQGKRKVTNELLIFHPNALRWTVYMSAKAAEIPIPARKHHAVAVYEQVMVVHGGVGSKGNYLNDVWVFNTELEVWKKLPVKRSEFDRGGLAYHTMCSVFCPKDKLNQNIQKSSKIQLEGFYVFGGKNEKGEPINSLQVLTYNQEKGALTWEYPSVKGSPPSPRYQHTMNYFSETNCLIVYGGRGHSISANSPLPAKHCYEDVFVLNLETLSWIFPKTGGDTNFKARFAHACTIFAGQMLVFGGKSNEEYIETGISILELKPNDVEKLESMTSLIKKPIPMEVVSHSIIFRKDSSPLISGFVESPTYYRRELPNNRSSKWVDKPKQKHLPSLFNSSSSKWTQLTQNPPPKTTFTTFSPASRPIFNLFKNSNTLLHPSNITVDASD